MSEAATTVADTIDTAKKAAENVNRNGQAVTEAPDWAKAAFAQVTGKPETPKEPAKEPEKVEPDKPAEVKPDPKAEPVKEPADDTPSPEERENEVIARRGLKRTGWTEEEIDALPRDTMLKKGRAAWDIQAKQDERFAELRGGRKPAAGDSTEPAKGSASSSEAQDRARGADPDLIPESVREVLDDDAKAALASHITALVEKAAKPLDKKASQLARERDEARSEAFELKCRGITRGLATDYPQLAGEKPPQRFIDKLNKLAPRYDTTDEAELKELFEDTAQAVFGKEQRQNARQEAIDKNRKARSGAPDTRENGTAPAAVKETDAQWAKRAFDAVVASRANGTGLVGAQTILASGKS